MIVKEKVKSTMLQQLEIVRRRLIRPHPSEEKIEIDYKKTLSGYYGEESLSYYLSFLPEKEYYILNDLRLFSKQNDYYFQIDVLLVTSSSLIILEVKNYKGIVIYDAAYQQIIQKYTGKSFTYNDPLAQVERQKLQLLWWLKIRNYPQKLKVHTFVVLTNPTVYIKSYNQSNFSNNIIKPDALVSSLNQIKSSHSILTEKEMRRLSNQLIKNHEEKSVNIMEKYGITLDQITCGMVCSHCAHLPLKKSGYSWFCENCHSVNKRLYESMLQEYQLLFGNEVNLEQMKSFFDVKSQYELVKILQSNAVERSGKTKDTKYVIR